MIPSGLVVPLARSCRETAPCSPHARGYRLFGSCCDCAKLYRMDAPPQERISSTFDIDLDKLIEERGAGTPCVRIAPVPCPRCGSRRTEISDRDARLVTDQRCRRAYRPDARSASEIEPADTSPQGEVPGECFSGIAKCRAELRVIVILLE
jgi:hypothetical protein